MRELDFISIYLYAKRTFLSLRFLMKREPYGFPFFVPKNQLLAFLTR